MLANIRGGGEYGPQWHTSAMRENRMRAYEDYSAVARDLIDRGVTRTEDLGRAGGSNGGLLVGNMLTQYPELFGAVSCGVPLLDMRRYTKLSAGYSWEGRIRRSRRPRGLGLHPALLALPPSRPRRRLPARPLLDRDLR